ncbi:hypothetical protein CMO89_02665 [Candidatus Woesearchaeota archaeon]|nr:hypothetical protein [Candidatus Woesearchaeota archaeon]
MPDTEATLPDLETEVRSAGTEVVREMSSAEGVEEAVKYILSWLDSNYDRLVSESDTLLGEEVSIDNISGFISLFQWFDKLKGGYEGLSENYLDRDEKREALGESWQNYKGLTSEGAENASSQMVKLYGAIVGFGNDREAKFNPLVGEEGEIEIKPEMFITAHGLSEEVSQAEEGLPYALEQLDEDSALVRVLEGFGERMLSRADDLAGAVEEYTSYVKTSFNYLLKVDTRELDTRERRIDALERFSMLSPLLEVAGREGIEKIFGYDVSIMGQLSGTLGEKLAGSLGDWEGIVADYRSDLAPLIDQNTGDILEPGKVYSPRDLEELRRIKYEFELIGRSLEKAVDEGIVSWWDKGDIGRGDDGGLARVKGDAGKLWDAGEELYDALGKHIVSMEEATASYVNRVNKFMGPGEKAGEITLGEAVELANVIERNSEFFKDYSGLSFDPNKVVGRLNNVVAMFQKDPENSGWASFSFSGIIDPNKPDFRIGNLGLGVNHRGISSNGNYRENVILPPFLSPAFTLGQRTVETVLFETYHGYDKPGSLVNGGLDFKWSNMGITRAPNTSTVKDQGRSTHRTYGETIENVVMLTPWARLGSPRSFEADLALGLMFGNSSATMTTQDTRSDGSKGSLLETIDKGSIAQIMPSLDLYLLAIDNPDFRLGANLHGGFILVPSIGMTTTNYTDGQIRGGEVAGTKDLFGSQVGGGVDVGFTAFGGFLSSDTLARYNWTHANLARGQPNSNNVGINNLHEISLYEHLMLGDIFSVLLGGELNFRNSRVASYVGEEADRAGEVMLHEWNASLAIPLFADRNDIIEHFREVYSNSSRDELNRHSLIPIPGRATGDIPAPIALVGYITTVGPGTEMYSPLPGLDSVKMSVSPNDQLFLRGGKLGGYLLVGSKEGAIDWNVKAGAEYAASAFDITQTAKEGWPEISSQKPFDDFANIYLVGSVRDIGIMRSGYGIGFDVGVGINEIRWTGNILNFESLYAKSVTPMATIYARYPMDQVEGFFRNVGEGLSRLIEKKD